jgi:O-antigen ligase
MLQAEPRSDAVWIVRWFCAWVFLLCFFYPALPFLRLSAGLSVTPDRFAAIIMLLTFAAQGFGSKNAPPPTPLGVLLGRLLFGFAFINLISWWIADSDATKKSFNNLTQLCNIGFFPALSYFVARRLHYTRAMIRMVLGFFAIYGIYLGVTSLAEHYEVTFLVFPKYILERGVGIHYGRSRGPFVDTIGFGGSLAFAYASVACLSSLHVGVKRAALMLLFGLLAVAIYFTDTRGVWLSMAVITATCLVLRTGMRRPAVMICSALVVAFLLGVGSKFSISERTLFTRRQNTVDNRLDNFGIAWNAFKANPVFGLGYGKFQVSWQQYYEKANSRLGVGMDDGNHSTFLGLLADTGIVGTLPLAAAVATGAFLCFGAYRSFKDEQFALEQQLAIVGLAAVETLAVLSLTNDLRSQPAVNIPTFWLVGMVASVHAALRASKTADGAGPQQAIETGPARITPPPAAWRPPSARYSKPK